MQRANHVPATIGDAAVRIPVGHSSPLITARYLETDTDDLDRLVLNLAA